MEGLSYGSSADVPGVVFPVDEDTVVGCPGGGSLIGVGGSLIQAGSSFQEERFKFFWGISSVEEVAIEGGGCSNIICGVTVLNPEPVEVSKDKALQNSWGVCRGWWDVQVEVHGFDKCCCLDGTISL